MPRTARLIGIAAGLTLFLSGPVSAQHVVTFEEGETDGLGNTMPGGFFFIPQGFAGFNWHMSVLGDLGSCCRNWFTGISLDNFSGRRFNDAGTMRNWDPTGFAGGLVGGTGQGAYTSFARLTRPGDPFLFTGLFVNPFWRDGVRFRIQGFLDGAPVPTIFDDILNASTGGTWVQTNVLVDHLIFSSSGGTKAFFGDNPDVGNPNFNSIVVLDDLTFFNTPEPASVILIGTGLLGIVWYGRRRRKGEVHADT